MNNNTLSTIAAPPQILRPKQAAASLGIGRTRLYGLIAAGEIAAIKLGPRSTGILVASIESFLQRSTRLPTKAGS